jgi:hypothetical protein
MLTDMLAPSIATVFKHGEGKVHGGRDQGTSGLAEPPCPTPNPAAPRSAAYLLRERRDSRAVDGGEAV